jgi:hypothetical protein
VRALPATSSRGDKLEDSELQKIRFGYNRSAKDEGMSEVNRSDLLEGELRKLNARFSGHLAHLEDFRIQ